MDWNGEFSRRRNNNDKEISQKLFKILSNQGNANTIFFFRFYFTPIRKAKTNKTTNKCCGGGGDLGRRETSFTDGGAHQFKNFI